MGMFDEINFEMDCPTCGNRLSNFQSKDGRCRLETLDPRSVTNFYSGCDSCGTWVEFYKYPQDISSKVPPPPTLEELEAEGFFYEVRPKRNSL